MNQMIGLFGRDSLGRWSVTTSDKSCDVNEQRRKVCATRVVQYDGGFVYDYVHHQPVIGNRTLMPIYLHVLWQERVRLAELHRLVLACKIPERHISHVNTDCVRFEKLPAKYRRPLKELCENTTYRELWRVRDGQTLQKVHHTREECKHPPPPAKLPQCFKFSEHVKALPGEYEECRTTGGHVDAAMPWKDLTVEEARDAIRRGESLLVQGSPGTGKTFWVREEVRWLRDDGKKRVDIVAKTHASVQNFGCEAQTADHWVRRHVRYGNCSRCDVLVVEEITQIDANFWASLVQVHQRGTQCILLGDFQQFEAIGNVWSGAEIAPRALERSQMLYDMAGGRRLTLRENRRSDPTLFAFYTSLCPGLPNERDLGKAVKEARRRFPLTKRPADYTLCLTHMTREAINQERMEALKPTCAIFIPAPPPSSSGGNQPQNLWVWPGMKLIGGGGSCKKGLFYTIAKVDAEKVHLANDDMALTHKEAVKSLRPAWALTYASVQGLTLEGVVRLLDTSSKPHFTIRHLYVGASRATSSSCLEVS